MSEHDPNGIPAGAPGSKLDAGKNRLGLVLGSFSNALWAVGEVGTYGATKYCDHGWEQVPDGVSRYTDALMRHMLKELGGEMSDADTDMLHAAHSAWNALARLELIVREKKQKLATTNQNYTFRIPDKIKVEVPDRFIINNMEAK